MSGVGKKKRNKMEIEGEKCSGWGKHKGGNPLKQYNGTAEGEREGKTGDRPLGTFGGS